MTKTILYNGTDVNVNDDGVIIWNGKIRNHYFDACGYPCVSIKTKDGWRSVMIHRLIALAFIPNPNNLPEVNHKDYDRTNFSIENLEWITHADNIKYSVCNLPDRHGEHNSNYGNHKLSQFYKDNPEIAKVKQGRPGKQNGRYKHGRYMLEKCNDYPITE